MTDPHQATSPSQSPPQTVPQLPSGAIRSGKLVGRSLLSSIFVVATPVVLIQFANAFVGLTDKIIAGFLDVDRVKPALDGLGIAGYVTWFISIAVSAIGVGGMAIIARAIGAGNRKLADRTLAQCATLSVLWGVVIGVALWLAAPLIASIAGLSPDATRDCLDYIHVLAMGMPVMTFLMVSMACLQGAGETTRPLAIMLLINVINIFASWAFSGAHISIGSLHIPNPFPFNLAVVGIAAGTVTAQIIGAMLMYRLMHTGIPDIALRLDYIKPEREQVRRITRIGLPGFLDGLGLWIGQLLAVLWVLGRITNDSHLTEGLVGSHEIAIQWESFSFLPGYAIGVAAGAVAGQYLGAGNPKMARKAVALCIFIAMGIMGAFGLVFIFFGEFLTSIISRDPVHLALAPQALFLGGFVQIFFAMMMVMRGAMQGVGDTRVSLVIAWVSTYGIRLPLTWILGVWLGFGFVGVWYGLCIELAIRGLLYLARFLHGGWLRVNV